MGDRHDTPQDPIYLLEEICVTDPHHRIMQTTTFQYDSDHMITEQRTITFSIVPGSPAPLPHTEVRLDACGIVKEEFLWLGSQLLAHHSHDLRYITDEDGNPRLVVDQSRDGNKLYSLQRHPARPHQRYLPTQVQVCAPDGVVLEEYVHEYDQHGSLVNTKFRHGGGGPFVERDSQSLTYDSHHQPTSMTLYTDGDLTAAYTIQRAYHQQGHCLRANFLDAGNQLLCGHEYVYRLAH